MKNIRKNSNQLALLHLRKPLSKYPKQEVDLCCKDTEHHGVDRQESGKWEEGSS